MMITSHVRPSRWIRSRRRDVSRNPSRRYRRRAPSLYSNTWSSIRSSPSGPNAWSITSREASSPRPCPRSAATPSRIRKVAVPGGRPMSVRLVTPMGASRSRRYTSQNRFSGLAVSRSSQARSSASDRGSWRPNTFHATSGSLTHVTWSG